jgi:hypothetical protein
MEPRKAETQTTGEPLMTNKKTRFRIEKLEERIAPRIGQKGHCGHGYCKGGYGGH